MVDIKCKVCSPEESLILDEPLKTIPPIHLEDDDIIEIDEITYRMIKGVLTKEN